MEPQPQRDEDTKGFEESIFPRVALPTGVEKTATQVVDSAFKVHKSLGPGLMESVYEECMCYELSQRGIPFQRQVRLPIVYDGRRLESGLRLDLLVNRTIVVELKAVEQMLPVFEAQLLSYLRLSALRLGFLINFNVPLIKQGIKPIII